jgi:hypothetical protein
MMKILSLIIHFQKTHKHGSNQVNHEPDISEPEAKSAPETKKQEGTAIGIGQPFSVSGFDETIMSRNPLHP